MVSALAVMLNVYADYGRPVSGARFVGRHEIMRAIQSRVLLPQNPGNLALIGEPRVGKSTIAHHAIRCRRDALADERKLAMWLNVGLFVSGWDLFASLVSRVHAEVVSHGWSTPGLEAEQGRCRAFTELNGESQTCVMEYFYKIRNAGVSVIVVLDEFDGASSLWSSDRPGFQLLRELSYDPASSVCLVTTSRRELKDIETRAGVISNLAGTFKKCYVRPFDEEESAEYFARLAENGCELSSTLKTQMLALTGAHPLFLDIAACELVDRVPISESDAARVLRDAVSLQFIDTYLQHVQLLREDGSLARLMQILFGPVMDEVTLDVDRFVRYGVIKAGASGYRAYSDHFQGFLRCVARDVEPWPLWRDTERGLRELVAFYLCEHHGADWRASFVESRPKYRPVVEQWVERRDNERARYGELASEELLDYSYPAELFAVMMSDWTWFGSVFGGQPGDWVRPFQVLGKVRTPLAHNRTTPAYEGILDEAKGICKQVVSKLASWRQGGQSHPS